MSAPVTARTLQRSALGVQPLVGVGRRSHVDGVVEDVDREVFLAPSPGGPGDIEGGQHDQGAAPDGEEMRGSGGGGGDSEGAESAAGDAPARAVAPVHEVAEARLRAFALELLDSEELRGRIGRGGAEGAPTQL